MNRWEWIKFLGIEPSRVGIEVMKHEFPWDDVERCMNNDINTPIEGLTHCPKCGRRLRWIRFRSPDRTWQEPKWITQNRPRVFKKLRDGSSLEDIATLICSDMGLTRTKGNQDSINSQEVELPF